MPDPGMEKDWLQEQQFAFLAHREHRPCSWVNQLGCDFIQVLILLAESDPVGKIPDLEVRFPCQRFIRNLFTNPGNGLIQRGRGELRITEFRPGFERLEKMKS